MTLIGPGVRRFIRLSPDYRQPAARLMGSIRVPAKMSNFVFWERLAGALSRIPAS